MTDACRWVSSTEPRVIPGRHDDACADETCRGCQPCTHAHCRVCSVAHSVGACPGCVGETRDNLAEILRMCGELRTEATHRGINGEAMVLLGPATDPEAWGHREASAKAGRVPADYLNEASDESHPLWVFGMWAMVYRDAFEHDEPLSRATVESEGGYLNRHLSSAATFEWVPFEDLARDLRSCVSHLKAVLHDEDRGVRANVACFDCGQDIERRLADSGFEDHWTCRGCRRRYTIAEYNFALRAVLETNEMEEA